MPARPIPFARFSAEVDALYRASRAPLTAAKMRQVLREFAPLAAPRTSGLTPASVAAFAASGRALGRSESTIRTHLAYLRRACNYAVARGYLASSPFSAWADYLGEQASGEDDEAEGWGEPAKHHSAAEIGRLLAALEARAGESWADGRLFALAALVAFTGLRRNEALYLRWSDVRLSERMLRVSRRRRLKRRTAAAPVPIPERLAAVLAAWRERSGGSPWVIPNASGSNAWAGGQAGSRPLDKLRAAGEAVGVRGITFRSLRHSWATHAEALWGLGELTVQRVLRHTRPRTQQHYRHADRENLVAAVRSIDFGPA